MTQSYDCFMIPLTPNNKKNPLSNSILDNGLANFEF